MGILDKLRPQSKSTHPDPNIRIEAIHELDPADLESLNAFAKDDTDPRVRRVAVARIGDPSVLADIVRNEAEGGVRDHALGQLVEQASKHDGLPYAVHSTNWNRITRLQNAAPFGTGLR